jgi:translation initiation factor 2 beta subunit (eIF-2beta)/eIF-5
MELTELELEISEWLLLHKDGLKDKLKVNTAHHLLPDSLYFIFLDDYSDNMMSLLKKEIQESFNITPEENLLINKKFVIMALGEQFLIPNK